MAYLGNAPARSFISFERQVFTIVNSQTAYTLDHSVNNENDIRLVINNIVQEPGSGKAYTASGTTLTLSAALVNGTDEMYCVFLGRAVATNKPGAGSVGTTELAADAVTGAKIADDAISDEHLDPTAITGQTAETTIADDDLILISDTSASAALKKMTKANFVSGVGGDNTPAFSARIGSNQSLSDNTDTKVNFDTEDFDTDGAFDTTNKRFTVPSGEGGKYFFYTRGRFLQNNMSQYVIAFRVNGAEAAKRYIYSGGVSTYIYNGIQYRSYDISAVETLSAGDYVEVYVKGDNVDGNTVTYENGTIQSEFSGFKLIGV